MATNRRLRAVREQILFAYAKNIIEADEFLLLYDGNQSKPIYPYWKHNTFDVGMTDEEQSLVDFGLGKNDLYILLDVFNIPNRITTSQGTACSDIEALCILLKMLAFPYDVTPMIGRNMTEMGLIYNKMVEHI